MNTKNKELALKYPNLDSPHQRKMQYKQDFEMTKKSGRNKEIDNTQGLLLIETIKKELLTKAGDILGYSLQKGDRSFQNKLENLIEEYKAYIPQIKTHANSGNPTKVIGADGIRGTV